MNRIKKYDVFLEFVLANPKPSETETDTPTIPRPRTRPGIAPTEIPSEEDSPMGSGEQVIDRLKRIYSESSDEEKQEIDSYFQK